MPTPSHASFFDGKIIAYRDGKGWTVNQDPTDILNLIQCNSIKWKVKKLIDIALMFSPIYNPDSHGGFIVYKFEAIDERNLEGLNNNEIIRNKDDKWLKGRNLLGYNYVEDSLIDESDVKVIERLFKISILDGAIVLNGSNFEIQEFGQRLNYPCPVNNDFGGTKRKTAVGFVDKEIDSQGRSIAIAISSDGPIRIFHNDYKDNKDYEIKYKFLTIFGKNKKI